MFEEFKETLRRVLLAKYSIGFIDGYETGKADGYTEGYADGTCRGFGTENDDEPIEQCKRCIACVDFDWEEEKTRFKF